MVWLHYRQGVCSVTNTYSIMLPYIVVTSTGEVGIPYTDGSCRIPKQYGVLTNTHVDETQKLVEGKYKVIVTIDADSWLEDIAYQVQQRLSDELTTDEIDDTIVSVVETLPIPDNLFFCLREEDRQAILADYYIDQIIEKVKQR